RNPPTRRATKAKASRAVPRNRPMVSLIWAAESSASSAPVSTSYLVSTTARTRSRSCSGVTPSAAATSISSNLPSRFRTSWAVARAKPTRRAPAEFVALAEADDPADREVAGRPLEQHLDLVADLVAGVLGRLGVDGQLAGGARQLPGGAG